MEVLHFTTKSGHKKVKQILLQSMVECINEVMKTDVTISCRDVRLLGHIRTVQANFSNMADYCIDIDRDKDKEIVTIYIDKVRFKHLGRRKTSAKFVYNVLSGRYFLCEERIVHTSDGEKPSPVNTKFDNRIWLKNQEEQICLFQQKSVYLQVENSLQVTQTITNNERL